MRLQSLDGGGGRALTLDDVMIRTGALFGVMLAVAAIGWTLTSVAPGVGGIMMMVGLVGTIGMSLFMMFRRKPVVNQQGRRSGSARQFARQGAVRVG